MGTYTYIMLSDRRDKSIKKVNEDLRQFSWIRDALSVLDFEEVFISSLTIQENLDYLNYDQRGREQYPGVSRPMNAATLLQLAYPFIQIGGYNEKVSYICKLVYQVLEHGVAVLPEDERARLVLYLSVLNWAWQHLDMIDQERSFCWLVHEIQDWITASELSACCQRLYIPFDADVLIKI